MWGEDKARHYLKEAGFREVVTKKLAHDIQNNWYVIKKYPPFPSGHQRSRSRCFTSPYVLLFVHIPSPINPIRRPTPDPLDGAHSRGISCPSITP